MEFNLQELLRLENIPRQNLLLEELFSSHIEPLIKKTARIKFSSLPATAQDEEDVCSETSLRLWKQMQKWMRAPDAMNVEDFPAYIAATTLNCCKEYFRNKYPRRWHLRNRLRYLFTHSDQFAIWKSETGEWRCRLSGRKQLPHLKFEEFKQRIEHSNKFQGEAVKEKKLSQVVNNLLSTANGSVALDDLLAILIALPGVREEFQDIQMDYEREVNALADPQSKETSRLHKETHLKRLWSEICGLPMNQRIALLLNLRDRDGSDAITSLPATGTASIREIAEAIHMPAEELAALWNELPLDDARIAQRLQLSRQQVINLRKSARERLAYRMSKW